MAALVSALIVTMLPVVLTTRTTVRCRRVGWERKGAVVELSSGGALEERIQDCSDLGPFASLVRVCFGDK
jgi:hypothetical protein